MVVSLRVIDGEILVSSFDVVQLTNRELLSKSLGGKSFYSYKLINSRSKPLKMDRFFNGEIFLIFFFCFWKFLFRICNLYTHVFV